MKVFVNILLLICPFLLLSQNGGTSASFVPSSNTTIAEKVVVGHASAFGYNNAVEGTRLCTVQNLSNGRFRVTFDSPHPDGARYEVLDGSEEDANRDNPKTPVERGSKTANGFIFMVTIDDNGGTADVYDAAGWSFQVSKTLVVLTE